VCAFPPSISTTITLVFANRTTHDHRTPHIIVQRSEPTLHDPTASLSLCCLLPAHAFIQLVCSAWCLGFLHLLCPPLSLLLHLAIGMCSYVSSVIYLAHPVSAHAPWTHCAISLAGTHVLPSLWGPAIPTKQILFVHVVAPHQRSETKSANDFLASTLTLVHRHSEKKWSCELLEQNVAARIFLNGLIKKISTLSQLQRPNKKIELQHFVWLIYVSNFPPPS
jgi:hypothetical protein